MATRCSKCGTFYSKAGAVCPKCGLDVPEEPQESVESEAGFTEEEIKKQRMKSWISILIGIPALILFIYAIYKLLSVLGLE